MRVSLYVARIVRSYEGVGAAILNKFSRLGYWPAVNLTACQPARGVCDIAIAVAVDIDDDAESKCAAVDARHFAVLDGDVWRAPRRVHYGSFPIPRNGVREYTRGIAARDTLKRGRRSLR